MKLAFLPECPAAVQRCELQPFFLVPNADYIVLTFSIPRFDKALDWVVLRGNKIAGNKYVEQERRDGQK